VKPLRFGIPSLDGLIDSQPLRGTHIRGIQIRGNESTSISIIGPDGTGKSILGLHLASYYLSDHSESREAPVVLYVSTDLSYKMAHDRTWVPFALDCPHSRQVPFNDTAGGVPGCREPVRLTKLNPIGAEALSPKIEIVSAFLNRTRDERKGKLAVGFIDLAANSAGDDWGFVNRVLALLPNKRSNDPAHLIILDSVDGFETLVGDLDAYGQISSRRARIAQIMRSANKKCHLVFVSEEPADERRIPEQFVTDLVIRLRKKLVDGYIRRTIELEKARGLEHVRGMHPYVIRSGRGSTTGRASNLDDRAVVFARNKKKAPQCYFHVFSSLHRDARAIMQKEGPQRPPRIERKHAAFGIRYLDNMLSGKVDEEVTMGENGFETSGLPCATVTALIGDALTQKTRLGRAFLSRSFAQYPKRLLGLADAIGKGQKQFRDCLKSLTPKDILESELSMYNPEWKRADEARRVTVAAEILEKRGCNRCDGPAVLLVTQDVDAASLAREFGEWVLRDHPHKANDKKLRRELRAQIVAHCMSRTICRRLEIHDLPSAVLMHIVKRTVWEAQKMIVPLPPDDVNGRYALSSGIRVVFDDFSTVLATYPEIRRDPLFLPALLFHLRREGVTTLIIDTHSGQPGVLQVDSADSQLRALVDQRLYTWHVPFYGENRVAIAVIPSLPEATATIRELRTEGENKNLFVTVDPEFELYTGLEEKNPQPVPLEVQVHEETAAFRAYMEAENLFYRSVFAPNKARKEGNNDIIVCRPNREYEGLREFCYLDNNVWLDYTLVFEVDEFWAILGSNALADLGPYLRETTSESGSCRKESDPFALFQPTSQSSPETRQSRLFRYRCFPEYFSKNGPVGRIDRVPFCFDFGFLICRRRPWELAAEEDHSINEVWKGLRRVDTDKDKRNPTLETGCERGVDWVHFLDACRRVAQAERARTGEPVPAFDLSLLSPESFSCLVLEIWASLIADSGHAPEFLKCGRGPSDVDQVVRNDGSGVPKEKHKIDMKEWDGDQRKRRIGLVELLLGEGGKLDDFPKNREEFESGNKVGSNGHWIELYETWLMLGEVLDLSNLASPSDVFEFSRRDASVSAVAARHWYKSASAQANYYSATDPSVPVQLPGRFSIRGDWFLAVARNSRSKRLAYRAIDILCSRRANINRLRMGVGLPVRDLEPIEIDHSLVETAADEMYAGPRTCLFKPGIDGERRPVSLADMVYIGADSKDSPINWFWRSNLKDYDRHSRIFQQWLCRMMIRLNQLKQSMGPAWVDSFVVVKELNNAQKSHGTGRFRGETKEGEVKWKSVIDFIDRLRFLVIDMKQASLISG
jgi:KaiC/GvpD/RAD55 family RecA-like ATPase